MSLGVLFEEATCEAQHSDDGADILGGVEESSEGIFRILFPPVDLRRYNYDNLTERASRRFMLPAVLGALLKEGTTKTVST